MKILFVGDVVGRPGRTVLRAHLRDLKAAHKADFVIVNAENAAAGYGVSVSTARELIDAGADCLTTGNHVWAQKEAYSLLDADERILRPANFPPGAPGVGCRTYRLRDGRSVSVMNLLGRIFMDPADCPFRAADTLLGELGDEPNAIFVDFHAEATSEKIALGYHLDGRVSAVVGTHTHVQTADEHILQGGTAYITDCGMTGPRGTVIGVRKEIVVRKFLSGLPARFEVPKGGPAQLSGVVVTVCDDDRRALSIERIQVLTDSGEEV